MASISPRIHPRPQYPHIGPILLGEARAVTKSAILGVAMCAAFCGPAQALQRWTGASDEMAFAVLLSMIHTMTWLQVAVTISSFDYYGIFQEYKLHRKPYQIPSRELVMRTLKEAARSQLLIGPLFAYYVGYPIAVYCGSPSLQAPLPAVHVIAYHMIIGHFFNEWGFYFSHRLVHHPLLYARIHKQHHTYSGTIGIAAEFASLVETFVSNIIPSVGGVLFFGRHPVVIGAWLCMRLINTYLGHSGYCFPFMDPEESVFHDHHHTSNRGNFGAPYIDWLFGTMDHYVAGGGVEGYMERCAKEAKENSSLDSSGG